MSEDATPDLCLRASCGGHRVLRGNRMGFFKKEMVVDGVKWYVVLDNCCEQQLTGFHRCTEGRKIRSCGGGKMMPVFPLAVGDPGRGDF